MNDDNLMTVWGHASKTDPSATKADNTGGYKSTSINGYWAVKKATELWGPCGKDWGYEILEDVLTDGIPLMDKESGIPICKSQMHTIKLRLWYPDCREGGVINYGHTPYIFNSKYGPMCDMEAPKKSLTDAVKKCLSFLGFSADIFMGEFDDSDYVEERRNEESLAKADDKEAEAERQKGEYRQWFSDHCDLMATAKSENELRTLFTIMTKKMSRRNDKDGINTATEIKDQRKLELEK